MWPFGARFLLTRETRERRRLGAVERGLPLRAEAHAVEDRLVAEDAAVDVADAALAQALGERGEAAARERRVTGADEEDVAAIGGARALAHRAQRRLVAEAGAQRRERRDRRDQLLVRGRCELRPGVVAVGHLAVAEVDDRDAGAARPRARRSGGCSGSRSAAAALRAPMPQARASPGRCSGSGRAGAFSRPARYRTGPTETSSHDHGNVIVTSRRPQLTAAASLGTQTSMRSPTMADPVSAARQLP